ncbi:MAG: hypothetical protein K1X78_16855 [Verrucomicrobiaceae bacterium]|nr:hypothetical protein [Verrucomicrobiaceae bacterium]
MLLAPCSLLPAAQPPELTVLRTQYDKAVAERVSAPFEAALAALNGKFNAALENASAAAKQTGKLDDVLAIEEDKKLIAAGQVLPEDDARTPESLKKLRSIYREQWKKLDEQRMANHNAILPSYIARLQELEATLTKADRIDEAKELRQYREGLGVGAMKPGEASGPVSADGPGGGVESGVCVVWNFMGDPVDLKAQPMADMPSAKTKLRQIMGGNNERAAYILAVTDKGKVIGWGGGTYGGLRTIPADLTRVVQVCPSYSGAAALDSAGRIHGWGDLKPDFKKLRFKTISTGSFQVLGITTDGKVVAWGTGKAAKEIELPPELGPCASVSGGDGCSMALQTDGSVWLWGRTDAPVKVNVENVRSAHWFFRRGIIVQNDGTLLLVDDVGRTGPLPGVTDKVPEGGGITGDGAGHYAIWNKEREWKFFGTGIDSAHCTAQAKGCSQIAFIGKHVFGIKPAK